MSPVSSVLDGEPEAIGGACVLGRAAPNAPGTEEEARTLGKTVDVAVIDATAAEEVTCGEARGLGETTVIDTPGKIVAGVADSEECAAAEVETRGESRALIGPVVAVTDVAASEEETCGEARAPGDPVDAADTDTATAEEETYAQDEAVEDPVDDPET